MNMTRPLALLSPSSLRTIATASLRLATANPISNTLRTQPAKSITHYNHHHRYSTTTPSTMSPNAQSLIELAKQRRSFYPLAKDLPISTARVEEIVQELVQQVPTSFNSQSNRVVVLFGAEHEKLWDITTEILKAIVPAEQWESTAGKMAMFKGAAGSVLFFEDQAVLNRFQENIPQYADRFPAWSSHSTGMLQYAVWTALEAEGLGANLQHYNPLVDQRVAAEWKVPADWKLSAQLVFGAKTGEAGAKEIAPLEQKYKSYGA